MDLELSDNQRRLICRLLFLLFCVVPTGIAAYTAFHKKSANAWAETLQAEMGLPVEIGLVQTPRPGEMIFRDFAINDVDGEPILLAIQARVDLKQHRVIIDGPVNMTPDGLRKLVAETSERVLEAGQGREGLRWDFEFSSLNFFRSKNDFLMSNPANMVTLSPAWVELSSSPVGRSLTLRAPGPNSTRSNGEISAEHWIACKLEKLDATDELELVLQTPANMGLPVWLVSLKADDPVQQVLGPQANFSGSVYARNPGRAPWLAINGHFWDVQLPGGVRRELAIVKAEELVINNGRWETGQAWMEAQGEPAIPLDNLFEGAIRPASPADQFVGALRQAAIESNRRSAKLPFPRVH